jgi:cytochrome c oxidase subunit 3
VNDRELRLIHPPRAPEQRKLLPNVVLGTGIFILTEIMFFAGFISAFAIAKSSVPIWPPPSQPRLPIESTLFNTTALLISGGLLLWAGRRFAESPAKARRPFLASVLLGVFFVGFQGVEWVNLIREGLTVTSSTMGGFFYLIVGAHALHACIGLAVLVYLFSQLWRDRLSSDAFWAGRLFWYFVVGLWPFLYVQVYL